MTCSSTVVLWSSTVRGAVSDRLVPPVQSLGLPVGPARACPVLQARPTCRRALHSCRSSDRCLSLYSFYYSYSILQLLYPTASLQLLLQLLYPTATLQPICSLYYSVYSIYSFYYSIYSFYYSYSTLQLLYSRSAASTHTPATRPSTRRTTSHNGPAHLAHTHTHTHTPGFFSRVSCR